MNGRKGRRIGCVLGAQGKVLEVLDMDPEDPDGEEDEGLAEDLDDAASGQMEFPDLLAGQGEELEEFKMEHGLTNGQGTDSMYRTGSDEL